MVAIMFLAFGLSEPSNTHIRSPLLEVSKESWTSKRLSTDELHSVCNQISMTRFRDVLDQILIPRVPGSTNITLVTANIVSHLQDLGWKLTHDSFVAKPPNPYPNTHFRSIVATHNPNLKRRLLLACHHDSKVEPEGFLGATDSAVPCSIMIEVAYALNNSLQLLRQKQVEMGEATHDITLQLVFFDGEEAFVKWSPEDSIYGARHLAAKWQKTKKLDTIDLFVLLDLIGTRDTVFRNYQATRTRWFDHAADLERRMTEGGALKRHDRLFQPHSRYNLFQIEDDHIPFLQRGVPVFHLIQAPFSSVWHTSADDYSALDFDRIELVTKMVAAFVAEYLHLPITQP